MHEVAYHKILEMIFKLFQTMLKEKAATYRNIDNLLQNLVLQLNKFNIVAVDRFFTERLFTYIMTAPDCVLDSILSLFAHLIVLHYRPALRESLIQELQNKLEKGNIKARCKFIKFC